MSSQKFTAAQREAIWLSHERKCAYTRELIDVSSFHIDHIIPETLAGHPDELKRVKARLGLAEAFDLFGFENLLPCRPGANLQKGALVLDDAHTHYFLGIASSKRGLVAQSLERIEKRMNKGRALVVLQQCLERGDLGADEVSNILLKHSEDPGGIFQLLEGMTFANSEEIRLVARSEIESLRDRPLRLGQNDHIDGVTLTHGNGDKRHVRTCREYDAAIGDGYFAYSTFDMKMATWFEHQCGLLRSLQTAVEPTVSYIANPRVGVVDLALIPFSFFPRFEEPAGGVDPNATYQDKVDDGTLVIKKIRQNLLQIQQPEGMGQQFIEVARADFNADGIEEILLFEYCYATHGTMGFGGIRILARTSPNGRFETVANSDA